MPIIPSSNAVNLLVMGLQRVGIFFDFRQVSVIQVLTPKVEKYLIVYTSQDL
jgi:hypothetical protein